MFKFRCLLVISSLVLFGCSKNENFWDLKLSQDTTVRSVIDADYRVLAFKASDGTNFNTQNYRIHNDFLFISNFAQGKIHQYRLSTGELISTFGNGIGRGPEQFTRINGFDIHDDKIAIIDESLFKIALFDIETNQLIDEHIIEVRPHRIDFSTDSTLIIASTTAKDRFISKYNVNSKELTTLFEGFGEFSPLKYEGYVASNSDGVVFAGYSEPMIIKANFSESLDFVRGAIDNYDTDLNYAGNTTGGQTRIAYTNVAQFYALSVAISDDHIFVHGINNSVNGDTSYIDIYSLDSGDYEFSVRKPDQPVGGLTIHDQNLTFISYEDESIIFYTYDLNEILVKSP